METTTQQDTERHLLYAHPDGRQVVFNVRPGGSYDSNPVRPDSPLDHQQRWSNEELPDDLETASEEIGETEALVITGHYLGGASILDDVAVQLARIRPGDPHENFCRALRKMVRGIPPEAWQTRSNLLRSPRKAAGVGFTRPLSSTMRLSWPIAVPPLMQAIP